LNWVPDIIHVHGWMAAMLPITWNIIIKFAIFQILRLLLCLQSIVWGQFRPEMIIKLYWTESSVEAISDLKNLIMKVL
jgi:starch synthase